MGYIVPGHGLRGKQEWLCENSDLKEMYTQYKGRKEIVLWCFPNNVKSHSTLSKRGKVSFAKSCRKSPYDSQRDETAEVSDIRKILQEKHEAGYSPQQLQTWANLIQMKKHSSLDDPPNHPFFKGYKKRNKGDSTPPKPATVSAGVSPGKRLSMRTELIDQLDKFVNPLEKGALTPLEYQDLQKSIMTDIKTVSLAKN